MERQQSNTLHTPNISNSLSTGDVKFTSGDLRDLSAVLKNCPEVNQLWKNSSDLWRRKIQRGVKDLWKRLELVWLNRSPEERNLKLKSIKSNFIPVFYNCLLLLFHDILNKIHNAYTSNWACIMMKKKLVNSCRRLVINFLGRWTQTKNRDAGAMMQSLNDEEWKMLWVQTRNLEYPLSYRLKYFSSVLI